MKLNLLFWLIVTLACWFVSGMAGGLVEVLQFHYGDFAERFPDANSLWWDPQVSWLNKYAHDTELLKPRFFLSTTVLVWVTDAYHFFRAVMQVGLILGWMMMCFAFFRLYMDYQKWMYLAVPLAYYVAKAVGFHLIYTIYF